MRAMTVPKAGPAIVSLQGVTVTYRGQRPPLQAVRDLSLDIREGETLGIIGESGSGKSTLLRVIAGLAQPSAGSVTVRGRGSASSGRSGRPVQMVFQDADRALNQRMPIWQSVAEPLVPDRVRFPRELRSTAVELLRSVGLDETHADYRPSQLSGGQRQRATIARALASGAPVVLFDEPMSGQDVSLQVSLGQLLARLREERELTYVIVSHDVGAIAQLADRVGVMYAATLIELGPVDEILERPLHPYTQALIAAVPRIDAARHPSKELQGEAPDLRNPPSGCRFHTRCPFVVERCVREVPALTGTAGAGSSHLVACHRWSEIGAQLRSPSSASAPASGDPVGSPKDRTADGPGHDRHEPLPQPDTTSSNSTGDL